jgi:hypothetical protein
MSDLTSLVNELAAARDSSDISKPEFTTLFSRAIDQLGMDDVAAARMLKISRATVSRWSRGDSAPHPLGRPSVFIPLERAARQQLG